MQEGKMDVRFDQLDQQWKRKTQWKTHYCVLRGTKTNGLSKCLKNGSITYYRAQKGQASDGVDVAIQSVNNLLKQLIVKAWPIIDLENLCKRV